MAVARSGSTNLSIRRQVVPQGIDELIEKPGDPELEFRWRRRRNRPHLNLRATAADELFAVLGNKSMKHDHTFLTFSRRANGYSTTGKPQRTGAAANRFWGFGAYAVEDLTADAAGSSGAAALRLYPSYG
jgi:hypothetical protein